MVPFLDDKNEVSLSIKEKGTCELDVDYSVLGFENVRYSTCFLVVEYELMRTRGECNVLQIGVYLNTG